MRTAVEPIISITIQGEYRYAQRTKNSLLFAVLVFGVGSYHTTKIIVIYLLFELVDEVSPLFLSNFALHFVLIYRCGGIKVWKVLLEGTVYIVVYARQSELRSALVLEDCPVGFHLLNDCRLDKSVEDLGMKSLVFV